MRRISFLSALLALLIGLMPCVALSEGASLTEGQANAIAMLNYITVLTQDINASSNSRLYMEEAYTTLINNTYPNAVDSRTLSQLTGLLDTMESYRMTAVKRERLEYIYQQNRAQALRAAVPNPLGVLSAVQSYRPSRIAAALAYMAIDSVTSYTSYTEQADLKYIQDGWALDDEEAAALHASRKGTFAYMINMVGEYDLPGDLTLTEGAVEEFVRWKNNDNVVGRIQFLESNRDTYSSYGGYWLLLARSYCENGDYAKCLEAMNSYEAAGCRIFRRDYALAQALPYAISAAESALNSAQYEARAAHYVSLIMDNTDHDDWAMRYYAAQVYADLAAQTGKAEYLSDAYAIALDNVNYLVGQQQSMNEAYMAPVQQTEVPKDATESEKAQIEAANRALTEARRTELPPVYEPLLLNCDLLFALADELDIDEGERRKIDGILHMDGKGIFLTQALDERYWLARSEEPEAQDVEVDFGGTALSLPVDCLTRDARIMVSVQEAGDDAPTLLEDWVIASVERGTEGDIATYRAIYTSESARNHTWQPGATIIIGVQPRAGTELEQYQFEYTTEGTKQEWYDYFKVWEGHRNNWYDYAKVWENSVVFTRVN